MIAGKKKITSQGTPPKKQEKMEAFEGRGQGRPEASKKKSGEILLFDGRTKSREENLRPQRQGKRMTDLEKGGQFWSNGGGIPSVKLSRNELIYHKKVNWGPR